MSIITDILEKITGLDIDGSDSNNNNNNTVAERPCSNCPSDCAIAGVACEVCQPYKKKLIDWVYHIDHLDEFLARYEVVHTVETASSTTHCPFCGANSSDPYTCEYCGSSLAEKPASSGKIQVTAASEIPNPIMEAQNVIWERYDAVMKKYQTSARSTIKGSLISDLMSQLMSAASDEEDDDEGSTLGAMMSEAEIKEAASLYKVTVGEYLTGLDNGKYLTLKGKKEADAQGTSASSFAPESIGLPGMAAIGGFAGTIFSNSGRRRPSGYPSHPYEQREPSRPSQTSHSDSFQRPSRPSQSDTLQHPSRPSSSDTLQRPSRPSRPSQSDTLQRPSQSTSRSSGSTERRRPDSHVVTPNAARERPQRPSSGNGPSGNRRDNMINRETGERMNKKH